MRTPIERLPSRIAALALVVMAATVTVPAAKEPPLRRVIDLNGTWQIAEGSAETVPQAFTHTVPVPGLVDLAKPEFGEVGQKSARRQAFWYRRTFSLEGEVPEVARLKVHKARYGTQVRLNGQVVGEHLPCFTPGYFDLKPHLKGKGRENVLLIRVGADRESLPQGMPTGWDFEKYRYLPGLYDSVELILSGAPHIVNLQAVPDLEANAVRVIAELQAGGSGGEFVVDGVVSEVRSKDKVGDEGFWGRFRANELKRIEFTIPLEPCRLWSPEDPFLYELTLRTSGDSAKARFGMRTFRFEPGGKYAQLNGKRYFLRGSNVTIYRFFEDAERGDKPWREDWVRRLHRKFKALHWNSLRYCIGFPPERWYEIADEEGLLIQDEFPIWTLGDDPERLEASRLIPEYTEWMRERWNHPSVVIWDAQNESSIRASGEALRAVRHLDRSNRPWENGWAEPQAPTDCVESHPYRFIRDWNSTHRFRMSEFAALSGVPDLNAAQRKFPVPILINEYGWLWLTRDGQPTCLTDKVYEHLLGPNSTVEQRRTLFARLLAAKTEFWRSKRECAGVLHFCALGYSRPGDKPRPEGGATSDHWIDVEKLKLEPRFEEFVGDAFHPVGVMLDFWAETLPPGSRQTVKVAVVNDLEPEWRGRVRLRLQRDGEKVSEQSQPCVVDSFGREELEFDLALPARPGGYTLVAELDGRGARSIRSLRDFRVAAR